MGRESGKPIEKSNRPPNHLRRDRRRRRNRLQVSRKRRHLPQTSRKPAARPAGVLTGIIELAFWKNDHSHILRGVSEWDVVWFLGFKVFEDVAFVIFIDDAVVVVEQDLAGVDGDFASVLPGFRLVW